MTLPSEDRERLLLALRRVDPRAFAHYADALTEEAAALGVELPREAVTDDDGWGEKLEALIADPVPVVSLTFGLDRLAFGINPRPYGWTNVGLVLIGALLIRQLAMTLGLTRGAGTLAASLWFLNFHGINQSILWVSGRTSLLVACAGTACATSCCRPRCPTSSPGSGSPPRSRSC